MLDLCGQDLRPPRGRKDLVMSEQRKFSTEFKRQVVEEYLSGVSTAAQLCRRHSISSGLLYLGESSLSKTALRPIPPRKLLWKNVSAS